MTSYEFTGRGTDSQLAYGVYMIFEDHFGLLSEHYKSWRAFKESQGFKYADDDYRFETELQSRAYDLTDMPSDLWVVIRDAVNWTEIIEALKGNWTTPDELSAEDISRHGIGLLNAKLRGGEEAGNRYLRELQEDQGVQDSDLKAIEASCAARVRFATMMTEEE
jgi:hypothetical protein